MYSFLGPPQPLDHQLHPLPRIEAVVRAGFPRPAEDLGGKRIDVLDHIVVHPAAIRLPAGRPVPT